MESVEQELPTGEVVGRFVVDIQDSPDPDKKPELVPATGTITFRSSIPYLQIIGSVVGDFTMFRGPFVSVLDEDGFVSTRNPDSPDEIMYRGMTLIANDSDLMLTKDWTWTATFNLTGHDGRPLAYPQTTFTVGTGQIVDLTKVLKVPASPGVGVTQLEGALGRAEQAALDANESALKAIQFANTTDEFIGGVLIDPETVSGAAINAAIADATDGLGGGKPSLAPLFLPTLPIGAQGGGPANVREGLTPGSMPGGGPAEEMLVPVTGAAGATTLTSTDTAKVAGFGSGRWIGAVSTGNDDFHVHVMGVSAGGVVNLRDPLPMTVNGFLSARFDDVSGQHMTRHATRAYVQHLLNVSPIIGGRGALLAGAFAAQPIGLQALWGKNATLDSTPSSVITTGGLVSVSTVDMLSTFNPFDGDTKTPVAAGPASVVRAGTSGAGQGVKATFNPNRRQSVLTFWAGAQRPTHDPETAGVRVVVIADGKTVLDHTQTGAARPYSIPLAGVDTVAVEVINTTANPWNILVSETTLRTAGTDVAKQGYGKIVCLGDSWMAWYDGEFGKALAEKSGATVINHGLGGMTTEWGLAWWDEYVTKEKPDEVWIHFFTNDLNKLTTQTFLAPDGSTKPMWTSTDTTETQRIWRNNIWEMVRRGQAAGIRVVVVMPSATVGNGQTFNHMAAAHLLEYPPLDASYIATPAEAASPTWYGNVTGKHTGKPLQIGSATRYATGPLPADAWKNTTEDALMGLQRVSLTRADYVKDPASLYVQDWGTPGIGADTTSITTVSGGDKFTVNWAADGAGGHRIAGDVSVIAGREYLSVVKIVGATGTLMNDSGTSVSGAYSTFPTSVRNITGGAAYLIRRDIAPSTGVRYIGASQLRSNGTTMELTVTDMAAIDLTALLEAAPNLAAFTDKEIADFALSLT